MALPTSLNIPFSLQMVILVDFFPSLRWPKPSGSNTGLANSAWFLVTASLVFTVCDYITDKRISSCFKTHTRPFM